MNIEHIQTFLDLVETKSFNASAERLGLTQSSISNRISTLERNIGKRLFNRGRAGTNLTTAGKRFEHHARSLLQEWNEAIRTVQSAENFNKSLRIGVQNDIATTVIGAWVKQFRAELPETSLYVEADYSIQMSQDLLAGSLDIGVMFALGNHFARIFVKHICGTTE